MPKPTVLMANIPDFLMKALRFSWSPKQAKAVKLQACKANASMAWLQKCVFSQFNNSFKTARKFWCSRKRNLKQLCFLVRKTNKLGVSTVTGGKDLAASAAYTRCFCRAVLEVFEAARANHEWSIEAPMDYIFMWSQLNLRLAPLVPRVRNLEEEPDTA